MGRLQSGGIGVSMGVVDVKSVGGLRMWVVYNLVE